MVLFDQMCIEIGRHGVQLNLKALVISVSALCCVVPCFAQIPLMAPTISAIGPVVPVSQSEESQEIVVPASESNTDNSTPQVPQEGGQKPPNSASHRFRIGPELGVFVPTKNLVKSRFGADWYSLGVGFGQYNLAPVSGQTILDISLLSNSSGGNSAYLLPIGAEYRRGLTEDTSFTPYVAGELDLVPTYVRSVTDNVAGSIRTGAGSGIFGGVDVGRGLRFETGYRWFTPVAGYDFSGASASIGFRF